jgi:hypothetical protein
MARVRSVEHRTRDIDGTVTEVKSYRIADPE